ncbi:MAG: hypothetical protein EA417_09860 [Gammaproteobacteria bacterium]|nr:MAG: hypothetical protein EA417_09860 [Gammaproteobacteria bacterium]
MNRLVILSNPDSGGNRAAEARFATLGGISGVEHHVTGSREALPDLLAGIVASRPSALAVNGGDGTLQAVLTALLSRDDLTVPPLYALPGGSTNMSARDLGSGPSLRAALRAFLSLRDRPETIWPVEQRPVLELRSDSGAFYAGLFFGVGTIVRGAEFWARELGAARRTGEFAAGAVFARGAWGLMRRQPPFADGTALRLRCGDVSMEAASDLRVSLLFVTVMRRLFLGMTPFWGQGSGALACTWLDDPPRRLLRRLPALLRGRGPQLRPDEGYHSRRTDRVSLSLDESWLLDGELHSGGGRLMLAPSRPLPFIDLRRELS